MVCIDDSTWFLKVCLSSSRFSFSVNFGAFSWCFSRSDFELLSLWFVGGYMHEPCVVLFPLIPLPNPWEKGLDFGVFDVLGFGVFLAEILRFLLIQWVLVDHNLAMECPWGVPTIPKVLFGSVKRIGRSVVGFGGVDLQVLFIPSCPGLTGLTGASDRSEPFCGFCLEWLACPVCHWVVLLLVSSWLVWSCFAKLCEGFFFLAGCGVFLFQGLQKSLRLCGTFVVRLL
jgi:hypothetical protein